MTMPARGSMTRTFLSLQVVANRLPSLFQDREKMVSGWTEMMLMGSAVSVFHSIHCQQRERTTCTVWDIALTIWHYTCYTMKPVLRNHCHARPPVLKDHTFLAGPSLQYNWTCHQRPSVLRDHIFVANEVVFQDRFCCTTDVIVWQLWRQGRKPEGETTHWTLWKQQTSLWSDFHNLYLEDPSDSRFSYWMPHISFEWTVVNG